MMSKMNPTSVQLPLKKLGCPIAAIVWLVLIPAVFADMTITTQSTDFVRGGKQQESTLFISKGRLQAGQMIHMLNEGKSIMLLPSHKLFISVPQFKGPVYPSRQVWQKTGKTEKICGLDAEQWVEKDKKNPDRIDSEVWIGGGTGLGRQYTEPFEGAMTLIDEVIRSVGFDLLKRGIALRLIRYDLDGKPVFTMTVTKVDTAELDEALFAPPADYTEKTER